MKSLGIIRRIDELGRIVLPRELRRFYNLNAGDSLEIYTDKDNTIVLKKHNPNCIFCGRDYNLKEFRGSLVCTECIEEMK